MLEKFFSRLKENKEELDSSEQLAKMFLNDFEILKNMSPTIMEDIRRMRLHNPDFKNIKEEAPEKKAEKEIALKIFEKSKVTDEKYPIIGKIINSHTSFQNKRTDEVELFAYNEDTKILRILELTSPDDKRDMLGCVLTAFNDFKLVDKDEVIKKFNLPEDTIIKVCPLVFFGGKQYQDMQEDRKYSKELIEKLGIEIIYLKEENGEYTIKE